MEIVLKYIALLAAILLIIWIFTRIESCNAPKEIVKFRIDSIKVPVVIPQIQFRDRETVKMVQLPPKADSNALRALLAQMDSIRYELRMANVRSNFSLDTVTPEKDSFRIDCDEINRRISFAATFAKREIQIQRIREVVIQMEKPKFSIGVGLGAILSIDGRSHFGAALNIQYNLITF